MTVSIATLTQRTRRKLNDEPFEDYLTASISTTSTTSVTVNAPTAWAEGDRMEVESEMMKVRTATSNPLSVKRAHDNTTAATHATALTALKNPRYNADQISEALNRRLDSLWPLAWKAETVSVTPSAVALWFDLTATCIDLIDASQVYGDNDELLGVFGAPGTLRPMAVRSGVPTTLCASGVGAYFPQGFFDDTNTVFVRCRSLITNTDITDGLMSDALVMGACAELVAARDILRISTDVSVGDDTVQPNMALRTAAYYEAEWDRLTRQLNVQLLETFPPARRY